MLATSNPQPQPRASGATPLADQQDSVSNETCVHISAHQHPASEMIDLATDPLTISNLPCQSPANPPPPPATFFCLPPIDTASAQQHISAVQQAWDDLCNLPDAEARAISQWGGVDQLVSTTIQNLPDPEAFRAGGLHRQAPALAAYFTLTSNHSKDAKTVMKIATNGLKLNCIPATDPRQAAIPNFSKKASIVHQMLQQASSPFTPQQLLSAPQPQQVHFPNHKSAVTYNQFVTSEIASMLAKDVVKVSCRQSNYISSTSPCATLHLIVDFRRSMHQLSHVHTHVINYM